MPRNPQCTDCALHARAKRVCIWGEGHGTGFIIGESPHATVGTASRVLQELLDRYGVEAYFTHMVKCQPHRNRKVEPEEAKACRQYVLEEIEERDPQVILLLGVTAMKAMIGKTKITQMNGQVVEKGGRKYVCAFNPAFILRDPSKAPALEMAISRYAQVLNGTFSNQLPDWRIIDKTSIGEFIDQWLSCKEFSFDLETTGLNWWDLNLVINCCSFTLDQKANWVLPVAKARVLPEEMIRRLFRWLVTTSSRKLAIGQNAKFDNLWLMKRYGVRFHLDFDTMLAHYTVDENSEHGLKSTSRQFLGAPDYDLPLKEKLGIGGPWSKLFAYGAADSFYTANLVPIFDSRMDDDDRWIFENLTMPCARVFEEIEFNGLYVDLQQMSLVEKEQQRLCDETVLALNKLAKREVNWNSPSDVSQVLYGTLGLTPTILTPKGAPSTAEGALVDLDHPITRLIEKYRGHAKFLSTYIHGWREHMDGSRLYLGFKLHGTVTGRFSSRLHQVPRDGTIRNLVIAPPGWTFIQMDLSQAELRIIAIVSGDLEMLACFKDGRDIHWRTLMGAIYSGGGEYVQAVYDTAKALDPREVDFATAIQMVEKLGPEAAIQIWGGWKEARKKAKGINFGFSYGQSAEGFITYAKNTYGFEPTLTESQAFRDGFFNTYRRLHSWHDRQKTLVKSQGFVRSLIGRKRRLPGIHSPDHSVRAECERQAINAPIQGFIGDYKAMIILEIHETFDPGEVKIVGEVHDSVLMWVKTSRLEKLLPKLKHHAEHPRLAREAELNFPIPLTVDIEVGPWGKGKTWRGDVENQTSRRKAK